MNMSTLDLLINEKIEQIVDAFTYTESMSKMAFIHKAFFSVFNLIPEAEKGSYYELIDSEYLPLLSNGYDFDLLSKLKFHKDDSFVDYICEDVAQIKAYSRQVEKRSNANFSKDMIETFKKLGTYESFYTMYAPIIVNKHILGIICLDNFSHTAFTDMSKNILTFYAQMISNFYTLLLAKEKEAQISQDVIMALVSAIEVNDLYTKGHGRRVQHFSTEIARKMHLSNKEISDINTAALLHDVGKIGIPSDILNKPGKLTEEEYQIIKEHPSYTKRILENITHFTEVVSYAYSHHEYYNGKGYPRGLSGDEIPLGAQIIMIADVYDALTDNRAYRPAFSREKAIAIIESESGKQFHPTLVKIAVKVFRSVHKPDI